MRPDSSTRCLFACLLALASTGCMRIQYAQPQALESAPAAARVASPSIGTNLWPDRLDASGRMGVIRTYSQEPASLSHWASARLGPEHHLRGTRVDTADVFALALAARPTIIADQEFTYLLEGPGSFIFQHSPDKRARVTDSTPEAMLAFVSGRRGQADSVIIERTWMGYYDSASEPARGLIVMMPGLFGVPEPVNDRFTELCRQSGWAVLRLLAPPSRFTERVTFKIDREDIEGSARRIADELGQRAAEAAYAVEAGVEHVHGLRPDLVERPHVLIGMSGGAMVLPTVHARTAEQWDAAVMVAGGSNFLLINDESNYAPWVEAMHFDYGQPRLTSRAQREIFDQVAARYLDVAPLDGYHLAGQMRGKPMLMLHGSADRAVPAKYGDELWERLGKPERWVYPAGHELLFITLNAQTPRVLRWLDERFAPEESQP